MKKHYKSSSDFDQGSTTVQRNGIAQISAIGIRVSRTAIILPLVVTGMGIGYLPSPAQALTAGGSAGCPAGTRQGPNGPSPETSFIRNGTFTTNPTTTGQLTPTNNAAASFDSNLPYRGNGIYPDDDGQNNPDGSRAPVAGTNPRGGLSVQTGTINYAGGIVLGVPLPADTANGLVGSNTYLYSNPNQGYDASGSLSTSLFQNPTVWRQTVTGLQPNTTYNFSGYFLNLLDPANQAVRDSDDINTGVSPQITLRIDPVSGGAGISASPIRVRRRALGANPLNGWQRVEYSFTTGAGETQATLSIIDTANNVSGDDFGLTAIGLNECVPVPVINKSVSRLADNNNNGILDAGDDLRYTVTVRNPSPNPISNLVISDFQTPNLQLLPNTANVDQSFTATPTVQSGFTGTNTPVPFTNSGTLPAGQTVTLTYNTRILPGATSPIINQASARFTQDGGTPILSDTRDTPTVDASGQNPGNVDANGRINQPVGTATEPTIVNIGTAGISGTLYQDTTQNATLDTNEARLPANITVRLVGSDGSVVQQTTTDANGQYRFTTVTNGSYTIQLDTSDTDIPSSLRLTSPQNNSIPVQFTGTAIADQNFGFNPSSISGTLYQDTASQNNTLDPNETRLPAGITVRLLDSNGSVVQTTTTTANGQYFFTNVPNGNYRIQVDTSQGIPSGFNLGTPNDLQVNFSGTPVNDRDFGFRSSGISGILYQDTTQNATLDTNEARLPANITVRLVGSDGSVVQQTTTDANGQYRFTGVPNGSYTIQLDANDTDIPSSLRLTSPQNNSIPVQFTGTAIADRNFGFNPSSISGTLYQDTASQNNTLDPNETRLPAGITVRLLDSNGSVVQTTTTTANGQYFFTNVPNGNYRIQVDPTSSNIPRGFGLGTPNDLQVNLTGTPVNNRNFGFRPSGISGTLYRDTSPQNNTLDTNETKLPANITVRLLNSSNTDVVPPVVTDANGQYIFTNVPSGSNYRIQVDTNDSDIPAGSRLTSPNNLPVNFTGTPIINQNFGFIPSGISGTLFRDTSTTTPNGTLDPGETGLPPGITVRLLDANNNPVATTTTDPNGQFTFTGVPNGNYRIQVDPNDPNIPRGFNLTTPNNRQINFTGTPVTGQNFGFVPQGISGTLFQDTSPANGNLDPGETRLPAGITVRLLDPNGNVVSTTTTDANGQFAFTDIPAGSYSVDVDPNDPNIPPGSTLRNARSTPVTLAAGGTAIVPIPFTGSASGASSLRLVKRITTATRGGAPVSGVSFDAVDPGDGASDITSAGGNPRGVRDIAAATASLQSGDEVEYTIYYINTGAQTANRVNFCDLIPTGTTFVSNSNQLQVANDQARQAGRFFGRLAPLPQGNPCIDSNNPNGAVIVDLGNVPGGQGRNYGLVRFRVRIN